MLLDIGKACHNPNIIHNTGMKYFVMLPLTLILCSCSSVSVNNDRYGFFPGPGMNEDSQDRNNTKYNLMDSPDGRQDPNAKINVWGATY